MKTSFLILLTIITLGMIGCDRESRDKAKEALHKASDQTVEKVGTAIETTKQKLKKASEDVRSAMDSKTDNGENKPE